jgi:hypothetical protein
LGEESKGKEPRRVHTYIPHQIPKRKVPKTLQEIHEERAQKITTKNERDEDHVWFEGRWMVASLCDE